MVMRVLRSFGDRKYASMRSFANHMLELDGRVINAEIVQEPFLDVAQDALADRGWDVSDGNVAGKGVSLRSNAPHVQIVHVVDAFDGTNRSFNPLQFHSPGRSLPQDVERLPH